MASTSKGRYSGKYAFSELLICSDCGGHFRRKTVKRNGVSYHYWRCINRLDYGNKYCSNSVGFEEEALKAAVCRALSQILQKRENGFELVKSHLIYVASADEKSDDLFFVDKAIKDEETRIMELAQLGQTSETNKDNYVKAIADCTQRIKMLRERRDVILKQLSINEAAKAEIARIETYLSEDRAIVDEFDDSTIRRLISSITVTEDRELIIYIKGGYEIREKCLAVQKSA